VASNLLAHHLDVLEGVGLVSKIKDGRESLYEIDTKPLESLQEYLEVIASQWDKALHNLKKFVEG
jgi:DNA-binding transcriptional ArsR family regulator